VQEVGSLRG